LKLIIEVEVDATVAALCLERGCDEIMVSRVLPIPTGVSSALVAESKLISATLDGRVFLPYDETHFVPANLAPSEPMKREDEWKKDPYSTAIIRPSIAK
jgi:hypothetical protein